MNRFGGTALSWRYRIHANGKADHGAAYGFQSRLSLAAARQAMAAISACPAYRPTPLVALPGIAAEAGVGELWYKDEAGRFGLGSFKALGGAYAVARLLAEAVGARLGRTVSIADLAGGEHRALTSGITVACASDGNHGRSVAAGAKVFGCRCVIFLHEGVSDGRADAIAAYGAQVVRTPGVYDDSVRAASDTAVREGWIVVADTTDNADAATPLMVMQGYSVLATEALDQLGDKAPTHVFLQGGVGGLAAAMVAHLWEALGPDRRPIFVVVEPERADCLFQSALAGAPAPASTEDLGTVMAGLSCGEVSLVAWPVLAAGADHFMTVEDAAAIAAMRRLAQAGGIVAGESGAAGLAGLMALTADRSGALPAGLGPQSRVLLIGTEGATDPAIYRELVDGALEACA